MTTVTHDIPASPARARSGVSLVELCILIGCYVTLIVPVPGGTVIRALSLLCLMPFLYVNRGLLLTEVKRTWVAYVLPLLFFISIIWSPEKASGIEFVVEMTLSFVIVAYTVARLSVKQIIIILFFACAAGAVASFVAPHTKDLTGNGTAALGLYSQKNALGKRMMLLCLLASYVVVAPKVWPMLRVAALGFAAIGLVLVIKSNSATADVLTAAGIAAIMGASWGGDFLGRMKGGMVFAAVGIVFLTVVLWFGLSLAGGSPIQLFLDSLHKDDTLTGRTVLWQFAKEYMAAHPLGAGVEGFWRPQTPEAVWIATTYHGPETYRFFFHNSFYECGIHAGYAAMIILGLTQIFIGYVSLRDFFLFRDAQGSLTAAFCWIVIIRSFTESDFYTKAEPNIMLSWLLIGFAVQRYARMRTRQAQARAVAVT